MTLRVLSLALATVGLVACTSEIVDEPAPQAEAAEPSAPEEEGVDIQRRRATFSGGHVTEVKIDDLSAAK